ncbi:MAG: MFS transporter [Myxococcota bacterium]
MTVYRGWWVVLVSGIGLMLHYGPVISGTFGVFLKPLSEEFGWSRTEISLGFSLSTLVLSAALPIIGRLLDRFGARRVIVPSLLLFGLGVLSFSILLPELWHFYAIYVLLGVVGSGTTPVSFSKVISHWFDRRRGIALALIATGSSLGAFVLPPFAQALIDSVGWRQAYFLLGLLVIAVTVPVVGLFLRDTPQMVGLLPDGDRESPDAAPTPALHEHGLSNREAWRSGTFWLIVVAFFLMSVSFHGCFIHLVPMLTDRGIPGREAALALSLLAVGSMTGRLGAGYLLDRFFGPHIAIALFGLATTGILLLWSGLGGGWAFLAATLLGLGMGAEGDIVPYLLSRYFGLRAFGEIYGYAFTAFVLGAVIGPLVMAASFDVTGSYRLVLAVFVAATLTATGLMSRLGSYPGWEMRPQPA